MNRVACLCLFALVACKQDPTQVMVQIHAEPALQAANGMLTVTIEGRAAGATFSNPQTLTIPTTVASDFPYVIALTPRDGDNSREWQLTARLETASSFVSRAVSGVYVPGRVVQVDIFLRESCLGRACGAAETCVDAACTEHFIDDVSGLPDYRGPMPRDAGTGVDASVDASRDASTDVVTDVGADTPTVDSGMCVPARRCFSGRVVGGNCVEGAPLDDGSPCGVGSCNGAGECLHAPLEATPRPLDADLPFGPAIAVSGERVVIGSPGASGTGPEVGEVHVYDASLDMFATESITPAVPVNLGRFGAAVAISGSRVVASHQGTLVHVFNFDGSVWEEDAIALDSEHDLDEEIWVDPTRILASGTVAGGGFFEIGTWDLVEMWVDRGDVPNGGPAGFGRRFDVDGVTCVVGGDGSVTIHEQVGSAWQGEISSLSGEVGTEFGADVAIIDDVVAVGAPGTDSSSGSVSLYEGPDSFISIGDITPMTIAPGDRFGHWLDFANSRRLVVGAPGGNYVVVFERTADGWFEALRLRPAGDTVTGFGARVAADENVIAIYADQNGTSTGALFVVDISDPAP